LKSGLSVLSEGMTDSSIYWSQNLRKNATTFTIILSAVFPRGKRLNKNINNMDNNFLQPTGKARRLRKTLCGVEMIKLLHLYRFMDVSDSAGFDYSGLWETIGVKELQSKHPMWQFRRVASFNGSEVGQALELPQFIVERYANSIDRSALIGIPIEAHNKSLHRTHKAGR
jgi:hypothetical protein